MQECKLSSSSLKVTSAGFSGGWRRKHIWYGHWSKSRWSWMGVQSISQDGNALVEAVWDQLVSSSRVESDPSDISNIGHICEFGGISYSLRYHASSARSLALGQHLQHHSCSLFQNISVWSPWAWQMAWMFGMKDYFLNFSAGSYGDARPGEILSLAANV